MNRFAVLPAWLVSEVVFGVIAGSLYELLSKYAFNETVNPVTNRTKPNEKPDQVRLVELAFVTTTILEQNGPRKQSQE